ncbi:MAG TPA: penicillin-binding protein 2 [Streptosporangiaceae bacterium]
MTAGDGSGGRGSGDRDEWPGRRPARRPVRPGGPRTPRGQGPRSDRRPGGRAYGDGRRPPAGAQATAAPRPVVRGGVQGGREEHPRAERRVREHDRGGRSQAGPGRGLRPGRPAGPARGARLVRPARPALRLAGPGRRLYAALVCIGLVMALFVGRLVQLQGLHWSRYRALAQQQMLPSQPIPIPVVRGSITSSDGRILAMTVQSDLVYADPVLIPQAKRSQVAAALAGPLGMTQPAIETLLNYPTSREYVVLKKSVPASVGTRIMALKLPGIAETPSYSRAYPNGDLAANLIGFTNINAVGDLHGAAGVEERFNTLLAGRDGSETVETGPTEKPIPQTEQIVRAPVAAGNLKLTIQSDIQWYAEQQCAAEVKAAHAANCSVVVMNPQTGQILALAQYPTFNPASPASVAATTDIPVQNVFQPGSTAKVITVAAALEHGGQTPMSAYTVPDHIVVDGYAFRDSEVHATARYTVAGILANSFNDGMVQVVQHVSPKLQYQYFRAFGLGEPTGLGLPGESAGILPAPGKWWGNERYTLSFGQGVAANAVQMASVYATIANGGVRVQPSIIAGTTNGAGKFTRAPAPRRTRVLQPRTAKELIAMLQQVPLVNASGGEPWGVIPGYSIASKTGTAQVPDPQRGGCLCEYGSSYIGMAPASDPQLVVAVNVQNPKKGSYFGAAVAGPVFYHVTKFALQTLRIPPDGGHRPRVRLMAP